MKDRNRAKLFSRTTSNSRRIRSVCWPCCCFFEHVRASSPCHVLHTSTLPPQHLGQSTAPPVLRARARRPPVLRAPARDQNIHSKDAKLLNLTILEQFLKFKVVGIIPKVFGSLGFVISANLKNANPKISSLTFRLFPRCHGQWLNSNLELRDELTLGTETMVLVRRPLVRHNIQAFDQARARAALSAITSRASAPLHVFSKRHVAFSLCPHGHRHVADLRAG